jgi:hypothetical protein
VRALVVAAHHGQSVERQVVHEIHERLFQTLHVVVIGAQVIGIDVGHHRDHRLQVQERGIALVGLGNQITAGTETCVCMRAEQPAADHIGRIQTRLGEHAGDQTGRRGLAVRTGHRNAVAEPHQFGEHLRTPDHRDAALLGFANFRIVGGNRAGHDDDIGIAQMRRVMAGEHLVRQAVAAAPPTRRGAGPSPAPCNRDSAALRRYPPCRHRRCRPGESDACDRNVRS